MLDASDVGAAIPTIPLRLAPLQGFDKYLQPVIAHGKVRYVGEPVAIVLADSRAIAEDALDVLDLTIEPLDAVPHWIAAETDRSVLFEQNGTNVAIRYKANIGDVRPAQFKTADYTRKESFRAHRHTALPMETRGVVAEWDAAPGRLKVSGATKVNFFNRRALAKMLDLPESAIDMIELDVGGGFGVRGEFYPEDFIIPFAARKLGRPVKWIEDRREHLLSINHSREIDCELEIAWQRDGTILALRGKIHGDMGAYIRTNGGVVPAKAAQFLHGPYRLPAIESRSRGLHDQQDAGRHLSRAGPFRGQFLPRAPDRHGGARSRHRPGRVPPEKPDHRGRASLFDRPIGRRTRPRRITTMATMSRPSSAACRVRLRREKGARRQAH